MKYGYGIDFGTTNSIAAAYEPQKGITLRFLDQNTNLPHPSVIWFRAGAETIVGAQAKNSLFDFANVEGNKFVSSIKREMGRKDSVEIFGEKKSVPEVAQHIFNHLRANAVTNEGRHGIESAVITIPVDFGGRARRSLRQAADAAGIYVKHFVHEPFAAIVGYLYGEKSSPAKRSLDNRLFLVFDWGGGTLDITVACIRNGQIVELSAKGLSDRAGDRFDHILGQSMIASFLRGLPQIDEDVIPLPGNRGRLRYESEKSKIALSEKDEVPLQVANFWRSRQGIQFSIKERCRRSDFEDLIRIDVDAAIGQVYKALEDANVTPQEIDLVLTIGGSSRIPCVRKRLEEIFGHRLRDLPNADTIIAEGAAIVDALGLQPTLAQGLCVDLSDGSSYEVFSEGTPANEEAVSRRINFFCTDNREGVARLVLTTRKNINGGGRTPTLDVLEIPVSKKLPQPYNHERVTVDFRLDRDMILHVSGKGATQTRGASLEIHELCFGLGTEKA